MRAGGGSRSICRLSPRTIKCGIDKHICSLTDTADQWRDGKDTSAKQPWELQVNTPEITTSISISLTPSLSFLLSFFLSILPPTLPPPSFSHLCLGVAISPPFTSLCVVVATPRPPHYNACVFVSGVAALLPLVSPFFSSLSLWNREWKKKTKQGQRTGESRRRRRREGGKGGRFVGEGRGWGGMQELEQSFSTSLSCFYLSSELLSTFPFVSEVAGCSPLL